MRVIVEATSIAPTKAAGLEMFSYGLVNALAKELDQDELALRVRAADQDAWAAHTKGARIESVKVRLDPYSAWQSALRAALPAALRKSSVIGLVRRWRAGSAMPSTPDDAVTYYPFHRVPALRSPSVVTAHDFRVFGEEFASPMDQRIITSNVAKAKAVVCSWPHPFEEAQRLFPEHLGKLFLVPLPVFNSPTAEDLGRPAEDDLFLYPASTSPHKNHERLLRAMTKVPRARLVCAGPLAEPEASRLLALVSELGLSHRVTFTGFISDNELRQEFARCTAVVVPTRWEAASGPIYEGLAWRKPVLASDIAPVRSQLAFAGATATLFDPLNPDDIATALRSTLENLPARRAEAQAQIPTLEGREWRDAARDYLDIFGWAAGLGPRPVRLQPHGGGGEE